MIPAMSRIMIAFLLVSLAAPAGAADRRFTVTDFDRVQIDGPFEVVLVTGKGSSAKASGSAQALDRVSVEVQGRTLRVSPDHSAWGGYPGEGAGPVKIELSTHDIRSASVAGSGSLSIDRARAMRFDIAVAGSGRVAIGRIEADRLDLGLLGSGTIAVAGKVKSLQATVQGSGNLDAAALVAEDATINADTAGTIHVGVKRAAKVEATGQGDTRIIGTPACTVNALGSGRVACGTR